MCIRDSTGAPGINGQDGQQGPKGDTGAPGINGQNGQPGLKGDPGVSGPIGPKGNTGAVGPMGPKGDTGRAGGQDKVVLRDFQKWGKLYTVEFEFFNYRYFKLVLTTGAIKREPANNSPNVKVQALTERSVSTQKFVMDLLLEVVQANIPITIFCNGVNNYFLLQLKVMQPTVALIL